MQPSEKTYDENFIHAILQHVAWGIRSTFHSILRASPGQVVFGCDMIINATYVANWRYIKEKRNRNILQNNARENQRRIAHDYQPGDRVFVLSNDIKRKLNRNEGPFEIIRIHTNGTVDIRRSATVEEKINIRRLHPVL